MTTKQNGLGGLLRGMRQERVSLGRFRFFVHLEKLMSPTDPDGHEKVALVENLSQPAFSGCLATQFFGAFNDNLFKQLLLLLAIATVVIDRRESVTLGTEHFSTSFGRNQRWLIPS